MLAVDVDLADDRFDVTRDAGRVAVEDLLAAVRELGYQPEVVAGAAGGARREVRRVDPAALPGELGELFARARGTGRPVLVRFTGPGCPPCRRMAAETLPHAAVRQELGHWLVAEVDVAAGPPVAARFGVSAIPAAVALRGDGAVLGRIPGFVEPERFAARLAALRR